MKWKPVIFFFFLLLLVACNMVAQNKLDSLRIKCIHCFCCYNFYFCYVHVNFICAHIHTPFLLLVLLDLNIVYEKKKKLKLPSNLVTGYNKRCVQLFCGKLYLVLLTFMIFSRTWWPQCDFNLKEKKNFISLQNRWPHFPAWPAKTWHELFSFIDLQSPYIITTPPPQVTTECSINIFYTLRIYQFLCLSMQVTEHARDAF